MKSFLFAISASLCAISTFAATVPAALTSSSPSITEVKIDSLSGRAAQAAPSQANNATSDCPSGKTYLVKSGENATAISGSQSVSTIAILNINSLRVDGTDLQAGATICLPSECKTVKVPQKASCISVAQSAGIALTAFKSYNLGIDGGCMDMQADSYVCVSGPTPK